MKNRLNYYFFCLVVSLASFASLVQAADQRQGSYEPKGSASFEQPRMAQTGQPLTARVEPTLSEADRLSRIESAVDSTTPSSGGLKFPGFPRIWSERSRVETRASADSVGLTHFFKLLGIEARRITQVKFNRKTSFVLVASLKKEGAETPHEPAVKLNVDQELDKSIVKTNARGKTVANVREGFPMVGLCVYEVVASYDVRLSGFFDVKGNSVNGEASSSLNFGYTAYSNLFQLSDLVPLNDYLMSECDTRFQKEVGTEMARLVGRELNDLYDSFEGVCEPESDRLLEHENGDPSCQLWFQQFDVYIKNRSVARCTETAQGPRCQLRRRGEGDFCFENQSSQDWLLQTMVGRRAGPLLIQFLAIPCDEEAGYRCEPVLNFSPQGDPAPGSCVKSR